MTGSLWLVLVRRKGNAVITFTTNTMVEIVVSTGGEEEREAAIGIKLSDTAVGEFVFKYYIDGTLQEDMTEQKDISLTEKIEWKFSNSGVHEYAIMVTSVDTGATGLFLNMEVDFTTDPPTKTEITFNKKVFKQLMSAEVVTTASTEEPIDEPFDDEETEIPNEEAEE